MGGLMYFVEGAKMVPLSQPRFGEVCEGWGLGHLIGDCPGAEVVQCSQGPGGGPGGALILPSGPVGEAGSRRALKLSVDEQEWRRRPDIPRRSAAPASKGDADAVVWWAGWWKDSRPGPVELSRGRLVSGVRVPLEDGRKWQVPYVERLSGVRSCTADGEEYLKLPPLQERFRALVGHASEIASSETKAGDEEIAEALFDASVAAIAVNYRVDRHVVLCLELLEHVPWEVWFAASRGMSPEQSRKLLEAADSAVKPVGAESEEAA